MSFRDDVQSWCFMHQSSSCACCVGNNMLVTRSYLAPLPVDMIHNEAKSVATQPFNKKLLLLRRGK